VINSLREGTRVVVAVAVILLLVVSHLAVGSLANGVLRFLEGYNWWGPLAWWGKRLADRNQTRFKQKRDRLRELLQKPPGDGARTSTSDLKGEMAALQGAIPSMPLDPRVPPPRLGNILRAGEDYPLQKYGIAGIRAWPLLWFCMPRHARAALNAARIDLY